MSEIYVYKSGRKGSHISLDNKKTAAHNETIDLDEDDFKRPLIKELIKAGKDPASRDDRLIKAPEPEEPEAPNPEETNQEEDSPDGPN